MSLTAQFLISGVEQSHFAEHYQFLVMINPFIAEKAILEKHKIVWKAFSCSIGQQQGEARALGTELSGLEFESCSRTPI